MIVCSGEEELLLDWREAGAVHAGLVPVRRHSAPVVPARPGSVLDPYSRSCWIRILNTDPDTAVQKKTLFLRKSHEKTLTMFSFLPFIMI